jgi:sensor domain CHASE-containing protein
VLAKLCAAARPRLSGNRNFNSRFPLFAGEAKNPKFVAVVIGVTSLARYRERFASVSNSLLSITTT